ncbi:MAG: transmembrane 220 family protein [Pseudomonadota bacterium]
MRIVTGVLCVLMLLFAGVQFNDPDGFFWMVVYGTGAVWTGLACFRTDLLDTGPARVLLWANLAAACAGTVYFWPRSAGWWRVDVWWHTETAREGMGMMMLVIVLLVVLYACTKRKAAAS